MPAQAMTLQGVSDRSRGGLAGGSAECLTFRQSRAPDGESFSSAAGRSLIVCAVLAAGIAGMIIAMGGRLDPAKNTQSAAQATIPMPKPRLTST